MTAFLTKHEYTELLGLTASARADRESLTTHDRARLVTLTEKASTSDMDDINAALIAAAPELLAALLDVLEMIQPIDGNPDNRKSVMAARAAIQKAQGEV